MVMRGCWTGRNGGSATAPSPASWWSGPATTTARSAPSSSNTPTAPTTPSPAITPERSPARPRTAVSGRRISAWTGCGCPPTPAWRRPAAGMTPTTCWPSPGKPSPGRHWACAAVDVVAEEPAHRQPHRDRPTCDGQVRQQTPITGMHPCRHPPAPPAPRAARPWMRGDHQRCVDAVDVVDHHRRQMRKKNPATALTSHNPRAPRQAGRHQSR